VWIAPESSVPVIGASGAIAGVLGAYFIFYPRARVLTILPIFVFIQFIEIPAVIYLFVWFAVQLYAGLQQSGRAAVMGGVAWWAHVGGFMFGSRWARYSQSIARRAGDRASQLCIDCGRCGDNRWLMAV